MKENQKGFALLLIILLIVAVAIIGSVGYVFWKTQYNTLKTQQDTPKAKPGPPKVTYTVPKTWDTNTKFPTSTKPQTVKTSCYQVTVPGNFLIQKNGGCDIGAARGSDGAVLTLSSESGDLSSVEAKYKQQMDSKDPIKESDIVSPQGLKMHLIEQSPAAANDPSGILQQVYVIKSSGKWLVLDGAEPTQSQSDNVYQSIVNSLALED